MPPEVAARAKTYDSYTRFATIALVLVLILIFMHYHALSFERVGLHLERWGPYVLLGCVAALGILGLKLLILIMLPAHVRSQVSMPDDLTNPGGILYWLSAFAAGAFAEELWRAFCLVVLIDAGHSTLPSVALTVVAFGGGHVGRRAGGIINAMVFGVIAAFLFLWSNSLVAPIAAHFTSNMGLLLWLRQSPWRA